MSRYIDAEIFEQFLKREEHDTPDERWRPESEFAAIVDAIPDADVKPVVHAHRIHAHSQGGGTHWIACSNCEKAIDLADVYCRHCGAIMDEED